MAGLILSCTPPPSANRLWQRTRNGMTKSREYRAWLISAGWEVKAQQVKAVGGAVTLTMSVPANGRRDLDNFIKPVCDLLVSLKLIDGDRFKTVKRITMEWHNKPAMLIQIEPWQTGPAILEPFDALPEDSLVTGADGSTHLF